MENLLAVGLVGANWLWTIPAALRKYGGNSERDLSSILVDLGVATALGASLVVHQETAAVGYALVIAGLHGAVRIDLVQQIIPDRFQWLGCLGTALILATRPTNLVEIAIAMALPLVLVIMQGLWSCLKTADGLGWGDIKMIAWLAPLCGSSIWQHFLVVTTLAAIIHLPSILHKSAARSRPFPFAPYLALVPLLN